MGCHHLLRVKGLCLLKGLLLLLLSQFSCVQLCATPETAAHQDPPSLGFSRQGHWSGLPLPSLLNPLAAAKSLQSCPTLCNPIDGSPPGSPVPGILQARVLESVAMPLSRGSSQPRDRTQVSCTTGRFLPTPLYFTNAQVDPDNWPCLAITSF